MHAGTGTSCGTHQPLQLDRLMCMYSAFLLTNLHFLLIFWPAVLWLYILS